MMFIIHFLGKLFVCSGPKEHICPRHQIGQVLHTFLYSASVNQTSNIPFHSYDLCQGNTILDLNRIPVFSE